MKCFICLLSIVSLFGHSVVFSNNGEKPNSFDIGVVTFLTGPAAVPFGIPARNAAEVIFDAMNRGELPSPYNTVGLAGSTVRYRFVDENSKQKSQDFINLVNNNRVNVVLGYGSSSSCKDIAPLAEKLKILTVFAVCGSSQIFETINTKPSYVFRTSSHATMDNVAAARYVLDSGIKIQSIAGINQDYSWGQDSWQDFSNSILSLKPEVEITQQYFPKLFSAEYSSEILDLREKPVNLIHSSFWGNDVEALVIQGQVKQLFPNKVLLLTAGDTAMHRLGPQIPDGTIIGGRGETGQFAPNTNLNNWFKRVYFQRYGTFPTNPAYLMAQAVLGLKASADKSGIATSQNIKNNLQGLTFETPSGSVSMSLAAGHQAVTATAYGMYQYDKKKGKGKIINI